MLEPDFYTKWNFPIFLKIENGTFICNSLFKGETLLFDSVNGRLNNIYADYRYFKSGKFKYWHIELIDNDNENIYLVCFPYTSAMFQTIILKLATATTFDNIKIQPYRDFSKKLLRRKHSEHKIYAEDIELTPLKIQLPKINCYNMGGHIYKDYTNRINAIIPIIDSILEKARNSSTRARKLAK